MAIKVEKVWCDDKYIYLRTADAHLGRLLIARSARLSRASAKEREDFQLIPGGIHWNAIDEDVAFHSFFEEQDDDTKASVNLGAVPEFMSMSYIAQRFFGKSRSWLHNKLNANICNGKPASLADDEKKKLKDALLTLSDEIKDVASGIY